MKRIALVVLLSLAGCGVPDSGAAVEEAIANGTPLPGTDRLVKVGNYLQSCTGTLITGWHVLTAQHCTQDWLVGRYTVELNGTTVGVSQIFRHVNLDFAVLKLSQPLRTDGYLSSMYTAPKSWLPRDYAQLQGFGGPYCDGSLFGEMSYANVMAHTNDWDQYNVMYKGSGGAVDGDSGGPVWTFTNGVPFQTGVIKSGNCWNATVAATPETFEPWVFATLYHAPIPIPTTTACHNYETCSATGVGEWFIPDNQGFQPPIVPGDFWDRPLAANVYRCSPYFNPCPSSSNYYIWRGNWSMSGNDFIRVRTSYQTTDARGVGNNGYWGLGPMQICYQTYGGASAGMNSMDVLCDYGQPTSGGGLVCHGTRCANAVHPLPPASSESVRWNPCGGGAFYYTLNYATAQPDWIRIGGTYYSGDGRAVSVYVNGATTVSFGTDSVNHYSDGIRSLYATCAGW